MSQLSLSLLGLIEIRLDGQPVTRIKYHKAKALLAYLAVEADRPHTRPELAGLLWPDLPDATALKNLSQALSNLRQALGDPTAAAPFLLSTPDTLQFNLASDHTLDVATFDRLLADCAAHVHRSAASCSACAVRLEQAALLYRDDFLAHFALEGSAPFEEWAQARRETLRPRALHGLAQLAAYYERHGQYEQAENYARRQLALDPWREAAHRQRMRVLALTGQRNAALAHYDAFRRQLAEELAAPPERETTALFERLRAADPGLASEADTPPRRHALPIYATQFVGRELELAALTALIEQPANRLISLIGPGGIGKTRLAVEAATRHAVDFADGPCFVPLAAVTTAEALATAVAAALDLDLSGADPHCQLLNYLREKELLLVLDSVEHLLADPATERILVRLIDDLLEQALQVTLLVTSRERLRLTRESTFQVPGLAVPPPNAAEGPEAYDAVRLFVACARRARPAFALTADEAGEVAGLCQMLGGMPLGIELAAARVRDSACAEITAEISRSLDFLQAPTRDAPERHRSLRAAFDATWRLLSDAERQVFQQLAVFRGGFAREAAEQVAGATLTTLTALADKSWVQRTTAGRYDLHELVRQYGVSQLEAGGALAAARRRHAQHYGALAQTAEPQLYAQAKRQWLERLAVELGNLRAALAWDLTELGDPAGGLRLAYALREFWEVRGLLREGRAWLDRGLARADEIAPPLVAGALASAGWLALRNGEVAAARQHFERGLALGRTIQDTASIAWNLSGLGMLEYSHREPSAQARLTESLALFRQLGDPYGIAYQLNLLGKHSRAQGDFESAEAQFTESLALFKQLGDPFRIANTTFGLAKVARSRGDRARAITLCEQALATSREMGFRQTVGEIHIDLALLAHRQGDDAQAQRLLVEALRLCREFDKVGLIGYCLAGLGGVAAAQQQPQRAARLLSAAAMMFEEVGRRLGVTEQAEYDRDIAAARAPLSAAAFAAAWAEGQALTREQAIALGLQG